MRIVIINGTPHKGNTWKYVEAVKEEMKLSAHEEVEFKEIHLLKLNLPLCIGCQNCFIKGEENCPHYSILNGVVEEIKNCDGMIMLTSSYSLNINALTKNFIDHMSYNFHRPKFFGKKAMILSTTLGQGASFSTKYLDNILRFWGVNQTYLVDFAMGMMPNMEASEKSIKKTKRIARKFTKDIINKKCYKPSLKRIFYFNAWRAIATIGMKEKNADYRYWEESGLSKKTYAEEVPVGYIRSLIGTMCYKLFCKVTKKWS